jgi:hypothetical protein
MQLLPPTDILADRAATRHVNDRADKTAYCAEQHDANDHEARAQSGRSHRQLVGRKAGYKALWLRALRLQALLGAKLVPVSSSRRFGQMSGTPGSNRSLTSCLLRQALSFQRVATAMFQIGGFVAGNQADNAGP